MTQVYTFDNVVIIQQLGSCFIDNATAVEILRLKEQGYEMECKHEFPAGERCYVIMSIPPDPDPDSFESLNSQYNLVRPYMVEIHDDQGVF